MFDKLLRIHVISIERDEKFPEEMNNRNKELEEFMQASERRATKKEEFRD